MRWRKENYSQRVLREEYVHETETPMMPPTVWKESNRSANAAEVAATMIVIMITTVEWPRLS